VSLLIIEGWLGGMYDDLGIFEDKEDAERGIFPKETLCELLQSVKTKKIKIIVEVIEE
jgi:hypothetical protein